MRLFCAILIVFSVNIYATNTVDLSQESCVRQCEVYSYGFQRDFLGNCQQIEKCDVFSWNEDTNKCDVIAIDELITFPIACRDIPAY